MECSIKYILSAQDDRRFGSIFLSRRARLYFSHGYQVYWITTHWIPKQQCAATQGFTKASTSLKAPRVTPCRSRISRLSRRAESPQICSLILRHSPLINVLTTRLPTRSKLFISVGSIILSAHSSPNSSALCWIN